MRRRYGAVISAAVLALQLAGPAEAQDAPALIELQTISAMLDANDVEGLRTYLRLNPLLLEGDSDLARLLRQYVEQTDDITNFLGVAVISRADDNDGDSDSDRGNDSGSDNDDDDPPTLSLEQAAPSEDGDPFPTIY